MSVSIQDPKKFYAPLARFYERENLPPLEFQSMPGEKLPEPQRHLLVHNGDMTTRLERFHNSPINLRPLFILHQPDSYFREVLLISQNTGMPVEYGAIEIFLDVFPEVLRNEVLHGTKPLGGLLISHDFEFKSNPRVYFQVKADKHISEQLELGGGSDILFGRANQLSTTDGDAIAQIVEILPKEGESPSRED